MVKGKEKRQVWVQVVKRNAVVGVVVLFVCVAVYLNWDYQKVGQATDAGKVLGEAALVAGDATDPLLGSDGQPQQERAAVENYFANARLNRQQARDSALSILQESMAGEGIDQTIKQQNSAAIQTMADCAVTEAQIENLVVAKGYKDCVALIDTDGVSIVVQAVQSPLSAVDSARITDIVTQSTSFTADQIKIIEVS